MKLFSRCCVFIAIVALDAGTAVVNAETPRLQPSNTYALIVGVLDWEQQSLTTYPKKQRQDVVLRDSLKSLGVPAKNLVLLLDQEATRDKINQSLKQLAGRAGDGSTLIVYYAGHGMYCGKQGVFANYNIRTNDMENTGWCHDQMAEQIQSNFKGDRVLLFADCCFSGALGNVAKQLHDAGIASASLTSASPSNESTNNWTFSLTLVDLLSGQSLADDNGDRWISISEAADEVNEAMAFFEGQASGFSLHGIDDEFALCGGNEPKYRGEIPEPFQRGDYVEINGRRAKTVGRIIDADAAEKKFAVRLRQYSEFQTKWIPQSNVQPAQLTGVEQNIPPRVLPKDLALKRASVNGRYTDLLRTFEIEPDYRTYGAFHDWGKWNGTTWGDQKDLPPGYWVYVYPNWYIWGEQHPPNKADRIKALEQSIEKQTQRVEAMKTQIDKEKGELERLNGQLRKLLAQ